MNVPERKVRNMWRCHRQRASKAGQELDYSAIDLARLVGDAVLKPCPYCQCLVTPANWSVDHRSPTSRSGRHALSNLAVCCGLCNKRKEDLTAEEFTALMRLIRTWPPAAQASMLRRLSARPVYRRGRLA